MKILVKRIDGDDAVVPDNGTALGEPSQRDLTIAPLDDLRLALMTDLSHQLRTPVTSMRLALDGLLSHLDGQLDDAHGDLAQVARRNLDRIVDIVNRQLDLLGMALGDAPVRRRHVGVIDVLERVTESIARAGAEVKVEAGGSEAATAFTDPDRLESLLTGLLADGPSGASRRITVETTPQTCTIEVRLDYLMREGGDDLTWKHEDDAMVVPADAMDFERRACEAMVIALGGDVKMHKDPDVKLTRITLPVSPVTATSI